jgi:hypothetical protein
LHRSGAVLAWDFVHNNIFHAIDNTLQGNPLGWKKPPRMLEYIQDRDLWTKVLPRTDEFNANLFSYEYNFLEWQSIMEDVESVVGFTYFCQAGEAILRKQQKDIAELLKVCKRTTYIAGWEGPIASIPYILSSEACHQMLKLEPCIPFAACYWDTATHRIFSLRSTDQNMDVSEIAVLFGGGGHRNAAGFRVSREHELAKF